MPLPPAQTVWMSIAQKVGVPPGGDTSFYKVLVEELYAALAAADVAPTTMAVTCGTPGAVVPVLGVGKIT
jgi:hypothetical protein